MVVVNVFAQGPPQRTLAEENNLGQALFFHRSDPALRVGILKDRRLHPIHAIDHNCFGLRMCSTHCMDASSHWLSGGLLGVRNASIFMTIMAT
jgi:hypothetical protein